MVITIKEKRENDNSWITSLLNDRWGSTDIVTRGKKYNVFLLSGYIAEADDKPAGLIIYNKTHDEYEILTLDSLVQGKGIGTQLLNSVINKCRDEKCHRLWLITTNDNQKAQKFYRNRGFSVAAVYENAMEKSRKLKPEIPLIGYGGIPIKDEVEMELTLQ